MNKTITLLLTTRCNLYCLHCLREHGGNQPNTDLSIKLLEKVLPEAQELGYRHINFTGGEPGMHPQFINLIELVCSLGFSWSIITNGWQYEFYESVLDKYREQCKQVYISLDGLQEVHDRLRKNKSFDRVMKVVDIFNSKKINYSFVINLNSLNHEQFPDLIELAIEKRAKEIKVGSIIPNRSHRNYSLLLNDTQKMNAYMFLLDVCKVLPINVRFCTSLLGKEEVDDFCSLFDQPKPVINSNGEYLFCCDCEAQGSMLGNLEEQSFTDLYIKQLKMGAYLKEKRRIMIKQENLFEGFNSCNYCNTILAK